MSVIRRLMQKEPTGWSRPPAIPAGHRVYAIGDIHGQDDLLADLLTQIERDRADRPGAQVTIVLLGDLIDRGPRSAEVVERLRTYRPAGVRFEYLTGNHEEVLLRILGGEGDLVGDWLSFGGAECALSYGLDESHLADLPPGEAVEALRSAIPASHQAFMESFSDTFRAGDYLFVHAGIRPGIALAEQAQADLRWIRDPFLDHGRRHELMVVHGHTISPQVDERPGRIGIDTGAYKHGVLTALVLEGSQRRVLQAVEKGAARPAPRP